MRLEKIVFLSIHVDLVDGHCPIVEQDLLLTHFLSRAWRPTGPVLAQITWEEQEEGVVVAHNGGSSVDQMKDYDHEDLETAERNRANDVIHCDFFLIGLLCPCWIILVHSTIFAVEYQRLIKVISKVMRGRIQVRFDFQGL